MAPEREVKLRVPPGFRLPLAGAVDPASATNGHAPDRGSAAKAAFSAVDGRSVVVGTPTTERLSTTYLDTRDLRIARWGCSLRHRVGEGWTVKLPPGTEGSAIVRSEHLFPGGPTRPPDAAVDLVRAYVRRAQLEPVARLQTVRTRVQLASAEGEPLAEVVDDEVSVLDGRRVAARFRELEVEAAEGLSAAGLEGIVDALRRAGAGEIGATPKYLQALGPAAVGPPELVIRDLGSSATMRDVISNALARSVIRLLRSDAGVRLGDDPEAVHDARVATRRLRSHLRTYRAVLDPGWVGPVRDELRWLGSELGALRDAEVLEARLRASAEALPAADSGAAARVLRRLRQRRDEARTALLAARRSDRYVELLDRLVEAASTPVVLEEGSAPAVEVLPGVMERPWGHLVAAMDTLRADSADEDLHAARIRAKRARYAAESMADVFGRRARAFARAAAFLQDVLGEQHDAVIAEAWLRDAASGSGARTAFVAGELAAREQRAAARARRHVRPSWKALSRKRNVFWT